MKNIKNKQNAGEEKTDKKYNIKYIFIQKLLKKEKF